MLMNGLRNKIGRTLGNQQGAMLIFALVAVVIMGFAAAMAGSSWKTVMQRAKEEQLLWVGQQYVKAIESYYGTDFGGKPRPKDQGSGTGTDGKVTGTGVLPNSLDDLVRDPRALHVVRHLRRIYQDPMTGEDFVILKDPGGRIRGVRSTSTATPFRTENFPEGLEDLAGKERYDQWEFAFQVAGKAGTVDTGSGGPGGSPDGFGDDSTDGSSDDHTEKPPPTRPKPGIPGDPNDPPPGFEVGNPYHGYYDEYGQWYWHKLTGGRGKKADKAQ